MRQFFRRRLGYTGLVQAGRVHPTLDNVEVVAHRVAHDLHILAPAESRPDTQCVCQQ